MSKLLPAGSQTYSKNPDRYAEGVPTIESLSGAWALEHAKVDVGGGILVSPGRRLVDLTSGMGAVILGHGSPAVTRAIADQLNSGIAYPLPHKLQEEVAQRLIDMLTWEKAESVRFGKNGADVTTSAVRLARAVTGKGTVAYLDYHGHHDWSMTEPPMNGGVPFSPRSWKSDRDPFRVLSWIRDDDVAAIVLEGSSSVDVGVQYSSGWWGDLREECSNNGVLLILDEMINGFRMAPGGAAEVLGIEPDLACYGKAMANGMPLSAIVGPWKYMKRYEEDVFFSTTHGGEALSLAAANATLEVVSDHSVQERIGALGKEIIAMMPDRVTYGYPQRLVFDFSKEELGVLLDNDVLCAGYANLTLAHVEDDVARDVLLRALALLV